MGSGLIWAGIGKGISDAGATYGNMLYKAAESEEADQRAMQRAEALERLKDQMAEERAQRDASIFSRAQTRAGEMATARQAQQLESDSSSLAGNAQGIKGNAPAMTQEEMKAHLERLNPSERKALESTGLVSKAMSPVRQELQSYDDTIAAARELGGSSTMIKSLQDAKKERLNEIKLEIAEKKADRQHEATMAAISERGRQFDESKPIKQQQADAATARAARSAGGESGGGAKVRSTYTDDSGQKVAVMSDGSTKVLGKAADYNKSVAKLIADREKNDYQFKQLPEEDKKSWAAGRLASGASAAPTTKGGDNGNVKSGPGMFPEPKSPAELSKLTPGTRYKAPDGTIRIKS